MKIAMYLLVAALSCAGAVAVGRRHARNLRTLKAATVEYPECKGDLIGWSDPKEYGRTEDGDRTEVPGHGRWIGSEDGYKVKYSKNPRERDALFDEDSETYIGGGTREEFSKKIKEFRKELCSTEGYYCPSRRGIPCMQAGMWPYEKEPFEGEDAKAKNDADREDFNAHGCRKGAEKSACRPPPVQQCVVYIGDKPLLALEDDKGVDTPPCELDSDGECKPYLWHKFLGSETSPQFENKICTRVYWTPQKNNWKGNDCKWKECKITLVEFTKGFTQGFLKKN